MAPKPLESQETDSEMAGWVRACRRDAKGRLVLAQILERAPVDAIAN
jgi:hypothetical protein